MGFFYWNKQILFATHTHTIDEMNGKVPKPNQTTKKNHESI